MTEGRSPHPVRWLAGWRPTRWGIVERASTLAAVEADRRRRRRRSLLRRTGIAAGIIGLGPVALWVAQTMTGPTYIIVDPIFDSLRDEPRFRALMDSVRLAL